MRPGTAGQSRQLLTPPSIFATPLHWTVASAPRIPSKRPAGRTYQPSGTLNSTLRLPLHGLVVSSPRRLRAGRTWLPTGTLNPTLRSPLSGLWVRSPRRLAAGRVSYRPWPLSPSTASPMHGLLARVAIPFRRGLARLVWRGWPPAAPIVVWDYVDPDLASLISPAVPDVGLAEVEFTSASLISPAVADLGLAEIDFNLANQILL